MKAISLWQPWSSLLAHGKKRVETRHWPTSYRGDLLIHAAKKWNQELYELANSEPFKTCLCEIFGKETSDLVWHAWKGVLPFGEIVGKVTLVDCVRTEGFVPGEVERHFGDYSRGRYAWLCEEFTPFAEPIPFRGHQSLFDVPDGVVEKALKAAGAKEFACP